LKLDPASSLPDISEHSANAPQKIGLIRDAEKKQIVFALETYKGNRTKAADMLGISLRTLHRKMKEYEIS
jgi:DNA-binding NtrC family response regulator